MCLILFSYDPDSRHPLVVLANRDEFHARETSQAGFWDDAPDVLAGRDLEKGGTWMGVTKAGRFAAVTNYRSPRDMTSGGLSRGELTADFLKGDADTMSYLEAVAARGDAYTGFNLIVFDGETMGYLSNRSGEAPSRVSPGVHGLSNALLDTEWPKVTGAKADLTALISAGSPSPDWMTILSATSEARDEDLPDTGIGLDKERMLSARCIVSDTYGTRSSSFVRIDQDGGVAFVERTLIPADRHPATVSFEWKADR